MNQDCHYSKKSPYRIVAKYTTTVLMITWMVVIFTFSAKPAEESAEDSHTIGLIIGRMIYKDFDTWPESDQNIFAEKIDYPIRKTAHATEYAILAGLIGLTAIQWLSWSIRKNILLAWFVATLYAATDEFHQLFVSGRSGQLSDVCLDSVGAIAGVVVLALFVKLAQFDLRFL